MFEPWLTKLEQVHEAKSREERDAVYAFRYEIYVEELGRDIGGVDHVRKVVCDEDDEQECSVLLYTGPLEEISATVRLRIWQPGRIPRHEFDMLSMSKFPGIEERTISELGRLMIRPTLRGKLLLPSLVRSVYERGVAAGVDLGFCYCAPGLVPHYRKLGFRPYAAPLVPTVDGLEVPLVGIASDAKYLKQMGSPVASLVSRYYGTGPGKRPPFDLSILGDLLDPGASSIEFGRDQVWQEVQDGLLQDAAASSILDGLSEAAVRKLTTKGFLLDVARDTLVTRAGHGQREMYIVLEGTLEVLSAEGRRLTVLGRGDLFGELAFFRDEGRRTASVKAASDCHLLVLRRHFLSELGKSDPDVALQLHFNLGRILSERLVRVERRVAAG